MPEADLSIGAPGTPAVSTEPDADDYAGFDGEDFDVDPAPHIDEAQVRSLLPLITLPPSMLLADPDVDGHWTFTDRELDELTPPLTRIINRRPALRAAVARGDEAAVTIMLAAWAGRNMAAGHAARRAREEHDVDEQREADRSHGPAATRARGDGRLVGHGADGDPNAGVRPASD